MTIGEAIDRMSNALHNAREVHSLAGAEVRYLNVPPEVWRAFKEGIRENPGAFAIAVRTTRSGREALINLEPGR